MAGVEASFAEHLRRERARAGLTQEELAERAGLTVSAVSQLERGVRRRPQAHTVRALADALDLGTEERATFALLARGVETTTAAPPSPVLLLPLRPSGALPAPLTSFVGRDRELAAAWTLAGEGVRLLTLVGPGGAGKTRLAVEGARAAGGSFGAGVWFVDLTALTDPTLVPQTIATTLGLAGHPGRTFTEAIVEALRERRALLVLDNCEHVVAACAELVSVLLTRCPALVVVATSREPLALAGERVYPVPPLSLPPPDLPAVFTAAQVASLSDYAAVRLFVDRAVAVQPQFALTPANAAAVVQICRRLDGIPLAIELAAARVRVLAPEQIAARLDDRFHLLHSSDRLAPGRHQNLRALIDWSYDLLNARERILFRRLAVFAGGWRLEAVEVIGAGDGIAEAEVLDLLAALVDKSLVVVEQQGEAARYRLLESIRAYATDKLVGAGEAAAVRRRHRDWHLALAELAASGPIGIRQARWMRRLTEEHDNLRAAIEWSLTDGGDPEGGLRLVVALRAFWTFRHLVQEGITWYKRAVAATADAPLDLRTDALTYLALAAWLAQEPATGIPAARQALELARAANDARATVRALRPLALNTALTGDAATARAHLEEAVTLARAIDDHEQLPYMLGGLALILLGQGKVTEARTMLIEGLEYAREGSGDEALANVVGLLGYCALLERRGAEARAWYQQSLANAVSISHTIQIAAAISGLALAAALEGRFEHGARLFGAWDALCEQHGIVFSPREREVLQNGREQLRAVLGDEALAEALAEGRALSFDGLLAVAFDGVVPASPPAGAATDLAEPARGHGRSVLHGGSGD